MQKANELLAEIEYLKERLQMSDEMLAINKNYKCINILEINKQVEKDLGPDFYKNYCMLDRIWKHET